MRTRTWLSLVVVASLMGLLSSAAWACPPGESPPERPTATASAARGDLVHHLSHWRGPHGESWTIASDATACAELDLHELAAIGRVGSVSCRLVLVDRVTLVVPRTLLASGVAIEDSLGGPIEQIVPAGVPVDIVAYDTDDDRLDWVVRDREASQVLDQAAAVAYGTTRELATRSRRDTESDIAWLARGVAALDAVGRGRAVVVLAELPEGPPGVAEVQHALGLMADAEYLVVDLAPFAASAPEPWHGTPQLEGISHTGYATGASDAATMHRLIFQRFLLQATTPPEPVAAQDHATRSPCTPPPKKTCHAQATRRGPASWFLVLLTLWYVIGLKVAMFLMLHRRPSKP